MSMRSILILCSLAANLGLVMAFRNSLRQSEDARQLLAQQEAELNRLRETAQRIRPEAGGLTASGLGLELALLQKIKTAVAAQVAKSKAQGKRCGVGNSGALAPILNSLDDYRKKVDALVETSRKEAGKKAELVARVEEEARKMKEELVVLCSR